jgi:hypothetical protein
MNMIVQPTPPGVSRGRVIAYLIIALLVGFIAGGGANRWAHDRDIRLGQCVPVHGMECLNAINKK